MCRTLYVLHCMPYIVHCTAYNVRRTSYIIIIIIKLVLTIIRKIKISNIEVILKGIHRKITKISYLIHWLEICSRCTILYILYNVHVYMYSIICTIYNVHCTCQPPDNNINNISS